MEDSFQCVLLTTYLLIDIHLKNTRGVIGDNISNVYCLARLHHWLCIGFSGSILTENNAFAEKRLLFDYYQFNSSYFGISPYLLLCLTAGFSLSIFQIKQYFPSNTIMNLLLDIALFLDVLFGRILVVEMNKCEKNSTLYIDLLFHRKNF